MEHVPIYQMADFNQDLQTITAFHTMQLYGWKDLLAEAYEKADKPCSQIRSRGPATGAET